MESRLRVLAGPGALDRCAQEAEALGARALVLSPAMPEPRESQIAGRLAALLRRARIGHHPFPRVPRPGTRLEGCIATAAEAARESHCRLIIGLGDAEALDVARGAAAAALLPSLLIPTSVGYGAAAASREFPLPDVLLLDPEAARGSPPRRTASLGVRLLCGILERHAGGAEPPDEGSLAALEDAMRGLIDHLPSAVGASDDAGPRGPLAVAIGRAAEGMAAAGPGERPLESRAARAPGWRSDPDAARAAVLASLGAPGAAELQTAGVARFGREVLGIRETDDGRAASWAAGGIRQWIRSLGFRTDLPAEQGSRGAKGGGTHIPRHGSQGHPQEET